MAKFDYNDIMRVVDSSPSELQKKGRAWVVGVFTREQRRDEFLKKFPDGMVYTIEFEDGEAADVREDWLELIERP